MISFLHHDVVFKVMIISIVPKFPFVYSGNIIEQITSEIDYFKLFKAKIWKTSNLIKAKIQLLEARKILPLQTRDRADIIG